MPDSAPRLILLPGLGADGRMFAQQRALPMQLETPSWIPAESPRETLAHYARRTAGRLRGGSRVYIGGVSMGAVVALEAAAHLQVAGVILISGCRSHRDLSPLFHRACSAATLLPRQWVHPVIAGLGPPTLKIFEGLSRPQIRLMMAMLLSHSPQYLRWSVQAILRWELSRPPRVPVFHIHGQNDEVIPLSNVKADAIVPGGHHLINLADPVEVNAAIARWIAARELV